MDKEKVNVLSNVVIAFSTFVGVGGAIAYYLREIQKAEIGYIGLTLVIYILAMIIFLMYMNNNVQ